MDENEQIIQDGTTSDYLQNLVNDRDTLVTNLVAKGVEASNVETFTELVPKVLEIQPNLESKSLTITENTTTTIEPTQGKDGLSSVEITTAVPQPTGTIEITQNGTGIDVSNYATADVSVSGEKFSFINGGGLSFHNDKRNSTEIQAEIDNIIENVDMTSIISMYQMFYGCSNVTTLNLSNFDTSNVTNMLGMFWYDSSLTSLNLNNLDTSNVKDMSQMFNGCSSITSINLSNFNTTKVTTMNGMLQNCSNVTSINLSSFETPLLTKTGGMFFGDTHLTFIDMRNFDFTNITSSADMFGSSSSSWVPYNCLIIVKNATQKQWLNTNFSRLTNVKTVSEYEAEQGGE